jgi:hypothetical protein
MHRRHRSIRTSAPGYEPAFETSDFGVIGLDSSFDNSTNFDNSSVTARPPLTALPSLQVTKHFTRLLVRKTMTTM